MAGGRGERFWPASQPWFPKQFLSVFNDTPLIVQTFNRLKPYFNKNERVFIIPQNLKKAIRRYIKHERAIIEPMGRNTAPAICLAAMYLKKQYHDAVLHVMPADHVITPQSSFNAALKSGQRLAEKGYLVTYGITPNRAETGYGYIQIGTKIRACGKIPAFTSRRFTEKPSSRTARRYVAAGKYLWNSGIFTFTIANILEEIRRFIPEVYNGVYRFMEKENPKYFKRIPDISIDYGVMEKSERLCIVKGNFAWDDVGSWRALERYFKKDRKGNIMIGDVKGLEMVDTIMYTNNIPLKVYGIKSMIVVVNEQGVLVCHKNNAPDLKKLLRK
jgi:mannose-1-phosphate guanylyltransferase/mannose-6-phosphate isomerase